MQVPHASLKYRETEETRFKSRLELSSIDDQERGEFVSEDEDNLFHKVPRRILCYIDSCPSVISELYIDYDQDEDRVSLCVTSDPLTAKRFTVEVPMEKVVKLMAAEGIVKDRYDDQLFGIMNRHEVITRAISAYVKKNLQLTEYDGNMQDS